MPSVLIVEDDTELLNALTSKLSEGGFEAFKETDGKAGLDTAIRLKPDLILLDILMPNMDGLTVLQSLRNDLWGQKVPVIMLTNLNGGDDFNKAKQLNAEYLVKVNVSLEDIVKKCKEVLNEHKENINS